MQKSISFSTVALLGVVSTAPALGQVTIGTDDFDGGGNFTSRGFTPDNTANNGIFSDENGTGSFFDRFGIMDPSQDVPFDFLDDSTTFPTDTFGIFTSTDRDSFLGFADLTNNQNPAPDGQDFGEVSASWTYDISGYNSLNLALDFAAVGNFSGDEFVSISASIDGGAAQTIFFGSGTDTESTYLLDLESGTTVDRYSNPFFDSGTWDLLTLGGPFGSVSYAANDADEDGLDDDTGERTYTDGSFTNPENIVYDQQFSVNGVAIDNTIQTIAADIAGTGSELELTLIAQQNGGFQVIAIDDLVLTGIEDVGMMFIEGDYNGDDFVSQADLDLVLLNWGDATVPAEWLATDQFDGVQVSQNELDGVLLNWGDGTPPVVAIPEPTSLALLGLGGLALTRRRRA